MLANSAQVRPAICRRCQPDSRVSWTRLFCKAQLARWMCCSAQKNGAAGGAQGLMVCSLAERFLDGVNLLLGLAVSAPSGRPAGSFRSWGFVHGETPRHWGLRLAPANYRAQAAIVTKCRDRRAQHQLALMRQAEGGKEAGRGNKKNPRENSPEGFNTNPTYRDRQAAVSEHKAKQAISVTMNARVISSSV